MLDEIINYVQSLQRQVEVIVINMRAEIVTCHGMRNSKFWPILLYLLFSLQFLSMKLATVNPLDFSNLPTLLQKDVSLNHLLLVIPSWCAQWLVNYSHFPWYNSDVPSMRPFSELGFLIRKLQFCFSVCRTRRCFPTVCSKQHGKPVHPESVGPGSISGYKCCTVCFSGWNSRRKLAGDYSRLNYLSSK